MGCSKKIISSLLSFVITFSLCTFSGYASNVEHCEGQNVPLGVLTEEERLRLIEETSGYCTTCPMPRHTAFSAHTHHVLDITASYYTLESAGQDATGIVLDCLHGPGERTLSFSKELAISNSWSADISFSGDTISASLGFDVTFSGSDTAQFELVVPDGYAGIIYCYNRYAVKEFNLKTVYYNPYSSTPYEEYGTGTAQQWLRFTYNSELIPPPTQEL